MSIYTKFKDAIEAKLDEVIEKSKTNAPSQPAHTDKGMVELDYSSGEQYGYKERRGLLGPEMLKTMRRKDPIVAAIVQTRKSQAANFSVPQKDKYSPGFAIVPNEPADLTPEEKMELADPDLQDVEHEDYERKRHELNRKLMERQAEQAEDIKKITKFLLNCGVWEDYIQVSPEKKCNFKTFLDLIIDDRYTYNYVAVELIPTRDREKLHNFKPKSAGTIRLVSKASAKEYTKRILEMVVANHKMHSDETKQEIIEKYEGLKNPFRYVQRVRGKTIAAWSEDQLIFEAANPTVDPEDQGYGFGELEMLLQIITSHLYAEAHNRNFFTQGIGSKGILHIKGDNISRNQLEAFKRQWLNQAVNSRNAFRPPVIGMADDVKWVALTQSNREMEYENWMQYLIKVICAVFQIDPAEINFDISRTNVSTLNEANNESRIQQSRDKGLKPLLMYIESIINDHILPKWDNDLAKKYKFQFVGLDAESRQQEIEREAKEAETWKTINEIRNEHGYPPIENGDIVLNANYTQYLQMKLQTEQEQAGMGDEAGMEDQQQDDGIDDIFGEMDDVGSIESLLADLENGQKKEEESAKEKEKQPETKKSIVEYYLDGTSEEDED